MFLIIILVFVLLDIRIKITKNNTFSFFILFLLNNILIILNILNIFYGVEKFSFIIWIILIFIYIKIEFKPCKCDKEASFVSKTIYYGRNLIIKSLFLLLFQTIVLFNFELINNFTHISLNDFIKSNIISLVFIMITFFNGYLRIFFFSIRLRLARRLIISFLIWIPIVNFFVILYICDLIKQEYDHNLNKIYNQNMRKDSSVCETKYPIVLLHGFGFRDFKYINYWGRIPKNLVKNGAKIFYGHQEGLGSVEANAEAIKNKIQDVIKETSCEKVNIIAHSKGGLDARYTISVLKMYPFVASLTTISTPHYGSKLADIAVKNIPERFIKFASKVADKYMKKIGDENPDFYSSLYQLTKEYTDKLNLLAIDRKEVYYQSYMSLMSNSYSNILLSIPYLIISIYDKKNDGLVTLESSKWGNFREVFETKNYRGISHGDIIDLEREDYKNFDVVEIYINIISDLKNRGF